MRAAQFLAIIGRGSKGSNALENTEDRAGATSEQQDNVINTVNSLDPYGPSWQLVPGNVAAGTVYAQVPTTGTGDLAFTRASTKSRTNASGTVVDVASGVAAIDYRNADGSLSSTGRLLLEPQRTNLVTFSEQFDNAAWAKSNSSISANTSTAPNGTLTADRLTADGINGFHQAAHSASPVSGVVYTWSIYAKKNTNNFIQLTPSGAIFGANVWANFDVNNGTVGSIGSAATASIQSVGDGWYRCTVTGSATATSTGTVAALIVTSSTAARGELNTLTTSVFFWGAQLEAGAYASSYIRTTMAAVTRVADAASKTGISSLIGQTEGTIFVDFVMQNNAIDMVPFDISGSDGKLIWIRNAGAQFYGNGTSLIANIDPSAKTQGTRYKVAFVYGQNDFRLYRNGILIGTDTSGTFTGTFSDIALNSVINQANAFNQILLFKTKLTNAQLAAITTL